MAVLLALTVKNGISINQDDRWSPLLKKFSRRISATDQLILINFGPNVTLKFLLLHPFNGLFFRTTWASWYQKGKTSLDLNEARDSGISWTICNLHLAPDRTTPTPHYSIFTGRVLFLTPKQQCQSTKGNVKVFNFWKILHGVQPQSWKLKNCVQIFWYYRVPYYTNLAIKWQIKIFKTRAVKSNY